MHSLQAFQTRCRVGVLPHGSDPCSDVPLGFPANWRPRRPQVGHGRARLNGTPWARNGLETAINLSRTYHTYEVRALNAKGRALGTSKPFS